ncbi:MAG: cation transporter [Alphaproteobacteria bacterium]|nr:cation transporter [Alphaproteobacteria bacterium]MDE2496032.1 cation transporter [Alphaproteobacteria bacterium]
MASHMKADTPAAERTILVRQAFRLEGFTIAWMTIEAAAAIAAGVVAQSLLLLAFGIDSVIELASACVLLWRLSVELRDGGTFPEEVERRAGRIAGGLLFALAVYVTAAAGWGLWQRHTAEFSLPGLVIAAAAIPVMYFLSKRKLAIAEKLGSRALRADAFEGIACGWLSFTVAIGLIAQLALQIWWVDSVASLAVVYFLVKEGREAWEDESCDDACEER